MRIIHIITRLIRAGADENTVSTCLSQAASGHEVVLIHGNEFDKSWYAELIGKIDLVKVDSLRRPVSLKQDVAALLELRSIIARLQPDVVHTHTSKAGILGRVAAYLAGTRLIIHAVHILPFTNVGGLERFVYLLAERFTAPITHAFIDVSQAMRDLCIAARVGGAGKHHVVHSGFELSKFRSARQPADWADVLGIKPGADKPPVLIILGALELRKRQLEFVSDFHHLLKSVPDAKLLIIGEGSQRSALQVQIRDRGLENAIKLVGFRADPEALIALADVCVLPSSHEGLPRVVVQYLAGGKPCVVSRLPGIEEIIDDGDNGLITSAADVKAAVFAARDLLLDPERVQRLARGARTTDLSRWDVSTMCKTIEAIYENLAYPQAGKPRLVKAHTFKF
jgi:glycosyltransferase involved in cell wall biosynthesis